MPSPRFGSIRAQLQWLAALSSATALGVACGAFVLNDARMLSENKRQHLYRYAAVIARNAADSLGAGQYESAEYQLRAVRLEPTVTTACLYNSAGQVVSTYHRDDPNDFRFPDPTAGAWLTEWEQGHVALFQPIYREGQRVGSLFLRSTSDDITAQGESYPLIVGVVFLLSLAVSAALAARLQSRISNPIEALAHAARRISHDGDYSVRVDQAPRGQLGQLCTAFNQMLDRIEVADANLQAAHDQLNERVRERTVELQSQVVDRRYAESVASGQKRVLHYLATDRSLEEVLRALVEEIEKHITDSQATIQLFGTPVIHNADDAGSSTTEAPRSVISSIRGMGESAATSRSRSDASTAYPVEAPDGSRLAVITLHERNNNELSPAERDVIESAVSLASVAVEQRSSEQALHEAIHTATAASRAKSDFLANMSHEIRTPLNAILGFADLLSADSADLGPERHAHLQTIASSGRHLLSLINDVLDLSKIEAGQLSVDVEPTDPHGLLIEVMSLLRVRAVEKGLSLELEWNSPAPTRIFTDPARLRQVIVNLVGNAVKFTEAGSVRVVAELIDPQHDPAWLQVQVIDTGIGIPEHKLSEVFQPFVQADASVTRQFGGTGLGLAICRRLVQAMEGELAVESHSGEGSTFTIKLPIGSLEGITLCEAPTFESIRDQRPLETTSPPACATDLSGTRLLVVDDGQTNRRLIELLLLRAGAEVELAENGQQGVDRAIAGEFDAVLMDMQMPVMDGYTAARRLRDDGYRQPIIALTAHAMKGDEQRCLAAGCSDYLTKPIEIEQLLTKLGAVNLAAETTSDERSPQSPDLSENLAKNRLVDEGALIASTLPTDDPEFHAAVESFLQKCESELQTMQGMLSAADWTGMRKKAHWLKGSGGTAGYAMMSDSALRLEAVLDNDPDPQCVRKSLAEIRDLQARLVVSPMTA